MHGDVPHGDRLHLGARGGLRVPFDLLQRPRVGSRGDRGRVAEPGPRRRGFGVPARRADRGPGRAVRLPRGRYRPSPSSGPPGAARRDRLDGHHHRGVGGSGLPGPLRGGARGAGRAAPGGSPHRPCLRRAWQTGRPPGCAARWRDTDAARPVRSTPHSRRASSAVSVGPASSCGAAWSSGVRRPTSRGASSS